MIDAAAVLKWFSGKSLENAKVALANIEASLKQGFWVPGASRSARAAMTKANVAAKLARKHRDLMKYGAWPMEKGQDKSWESLANKNASYLDSVLTYGSNYDVDFDVLDATADCAERRELVKVGRQIRAAMRPVHVAMKKLDDTRPPPVFTSLGVSPTVTATLMDGYLDLDLTTVRVCDMVREERTGTDKKTGKPFTYFVFVLVWPEGTRFGASRFASNGTHCEACGHAIHNPFNWVPVIIDSKNGTPNAFWTGRDCAKSVFGIDMKGDLELAEGQR